MSAPIFLDFEATGLHKLSYPIQVAWGSTLDNVESWYIQPAKGWTFWSRDAEAMHGLSRELLAEVGRPVREVAERMSAALAGKVVYADGLPWDNFWLDELFYAAQVKREFDIRDAWDLFRQHIPTRPTLEDAMFSTQASALAVKDAVLSQLNAKARAQVPGREHQAETDTRYLIATWLLIQERKREYQSAWDAHTFGVPMG